MSVPDFSAAGRVNGQQDDAARAAGTVEPEPAPGEIIDASVDDYRPPAGWDDSDCEPSSTVALFEGDEGGLDLAQRRALVVLLKQRFMTAASHPKEWRALTANPRLVRARLHDLFLDLHLDLDREVAFKRQVKPEGGGRFPTLLHDTAWTREETILLVQLRGRSRSDQAAGASRTFVDRDDMLDHVASLRPPTATDQAGDSRRASNAIDNLASAGLLIGSVGAGRYEVSQAVDVLLPLERLNELLAWLRSNRSHGGADATGNDGAESGDGNDRAGVERG